MKKYMPVWIDKYSDPAQFYNFGWIYESAEDDRRYSLLPLRYYGLGEVYGDSFGRNFSINHLYPQASGEHWLKLYITPAYYYFAQKLYEAAAQRVLDKYRQLENVEFGKQSPDGIYPCTFAVPYSTLLSEIEDQIKAVYDSGFTVDERLEKLEENKFYNTVWTTVRLNGIIDGKPDEISEYFFKCHPDNYLNRDLKKHLRYPLEECYKLYRIFSEEELCIGNQRRIYIENEKRYKEEFYAATHGDFDTLLEFVNNGFDLNTMGKLGETAFSKFASKCNTFEQLDKLIALGANPALFGCEYPVFLSPLWNACEDCNIPLVEYLLEKGVSPTFMPYVMEGSTELVIEKMDRWADEEDEEWICSAFRKIEKILRKYCN